jgi:hypothetical protein
MKEVIVSGERAAKASILSAFLERVEPIFDVMTVGPKKKRRANVIGFRFTPKEGNSLLSDVMEIGDSRTGRGSSPR